MSHCMFGYPIRSDDGTFQDFGSWEATLPLTNLQNRHGTQVARSTDAAMASTKLRHDLGAPCYVGAVALLFHNLSLAGEVVVAGRNSETIAMEAMTVTNLTAEYYARLYNGSDVEISMGSNWDANSWEISGWVKPNFDYDDGENHVLLDLYGASTANRIYTYKTSTNSIYIYAIIGGVAYGVGANLIFTAGTEISINMRLSNGTLSLLLDTDGDTVLELTTKNGLPQFGALAWDAFVGATYSGTLPSDCSHNWLITSPGRSDDAIQDRFNSGNGMALDGDDSWLARHGEDLVLHVGGNSDGSAIQMDTFDGAADLLAGDAEGRYLIDSAGDYITFANTAEFDGATALSFMFEWEADASASDGSLFGSGGLAAAGTSSIGVSHHLLTRIFCYFGGGSNSVYQYFGGITPVVGTRMLIGVAVDLGEAGTDRVKFYYSVRDSVTGHYGSWTEFTGAKGSGGTVPAALAVEAQDHLVGGNTLDGKMDTFAWKIGTAHDFTAIKPGPDDVFPSLWDHFWTMDGNANDQIAALNGTPTGASQVADGRHGKGQMERWDPEGAYGFKVGDVITTADPGAGADGIAQATWEIYFTATGAAGSAVFGRADGADNQFAIFESVTGLRLYVANAGADAGQYADFPIAGYAQGKKYKTTLVYDGGLGAGSRAALYYKELDPESGKYGDQVTPTPAVTGVLPVVTRACALGYDFGTMTGFGGTSDGLAIDEVRVWYGVALTSGEADAESIYTAPVKAGISHRWDMDGDAVDSVAALNGTPTGPIQVADGRQLEGWTISGEPEVQRTTYLARKTFSRDSDASYWDQDDLLLRTAPPGHLRDRDNVLANDGNRYRVTRLEDARENGFSYSEDLSNAAWGKWNGTVSANVVAAPDGELTADKFVEAVDVAQTHFLYRSTPALTDDTDSSFSIFAKAGERTWLLINTVNKAAGGLSTYFDLGNGVVGGTHQHNLYGMEDYGNGWYRCWVVFDSDSGGTSPSTYVYLAEANADPTYNGDGTSGLYLWGLQFEVDKPFPSTYIPTGAAAVTRAVDSFADEYTAVPQEATYLWEGVLADAWNTGTSKGLFAVGNVGSGNARLYAFLAPTMNRLYVGFDDGGSLELGYFTDVITLDDHLALRIYQAANGALTIRLSINGAAEVSPAVAPGTQALPAAWGNESIRYADLSGSNPSNQGLASFKAASGSEKSLATMQALSESDASVLYFYTPGQYVDEGSYGVRIKSLDGAGYFLGLTTPSITDEDWVTLWGRGREVGGNAELRFAPGGAFSGTLYAGLLTGDYLSIAALAARAQATGAAYPRLFLSATGIEAYWDDIRAYEFAIIIPTADDPGWPYYSGWLEAIPDIYPADMPQWEVPASRDGSLQQAEYDAGYIPAFIHIPSSPVTARYWAVLIKDTGNSDGYVEAGRLVIASTYQPSINMAAGAEIGWVTGAKRITGPSGATFYIDDEGRRRMAFAFKTVDLDEAMVHGFEMQRALGISKQFLFIFDPEDTVHMHRRSFLAVLEKLSPLAMPYISEAEEPWEVIEEL